MCTHRNIPIICFLYVSNAEPGFSDASTAGAIEDAKSDVDLGDIVTKGVVWGLRNKAS